MPIFAALRHVTQYRYDRLVTLGTQLIRLRPAAHCRTSISSYGLDISPAHFINWQQDPFGNYIARVAFPEKTEEFTVEVNLVAEMVAINPFDFFLEPSAELFPFEYDAALAADLQPYRRTDEASPELSAWLEEVDREPRRTLDVLMALNHRLSEDIRYVVRMEPGVQTPAQTLKLASGSCRDSGWLLVHILRHLGFAARFVSGYLIQLTADQESLDGPSGPDADFCDLHAWAEVYVPGAGWIGLDPTSGLLAGEGHLPVACTPEPLGAAPVSGTVDESEVEFDFSMDLTRLVESPRVTKPYSDAEWAAIEATGQLVDERLERGDVRLTMGGEPTFVSLDDLEGEEWSTGADSPAKSALAAKLIERLRKRFAPTASVHFGQGKWYPGEPLPRWAYGLFWREDAEPLWSRPALIATEPAEQVAPSRAKEFAEALAGRLGLDPALAQAAFEDPLAAAKATVEAEATEAHEELDSRERIARALAGGLGEPRCFVLPIQAAQSRDARRRWRSERWAKEGQPLFLLAGDSPAGLRLPLASLPPVDDDDDLGPLVPFLRAPALPTRGQLRLMRSEASSESAESAPPRGVRTALTVEPRGGFLYVFLPPLNEVEDYVSLIGAVEEVAETLEQPIRIEGYDPPADHRVRCLRVTPDPGVIEVNVAPAASWTELVENTEALYEEARLCRLTAEKFMLDGRHAGTGGGNHVVLGGPTPSDSAFLRRPDLLKSLVGYFNNHPSLSFLFSGLFIGPTSQAPRVDQARDDALYELQIAFDQVPDRSTEVPPAWLVDRLFRDVLVDVTGNTHRTEICIDKLYSPDSATGRQGLVEFRGFEMPPHARMSLAQGLLIRALVARFWEEPYEGRLQHWGTTLHDRFMLPCFVRQDFDEVIAETRAAGVPLEASWFAPHFEFRFPKLGSVDLAGGHLELRGALEPWHVTGEHGVSGGTARYVDSSLERLQVHVTGFAESRYAVTCNGRRVPLQPTGVAGSFAAGVRYRAWQPPNCLHPTIGVHAPLAFDVVDLAAGRSIGGCSYHVGHPGGRNHEAFPVNALEAEGRRLGRFSTVHHAGRARDVLEESPNRSFPFTLDLRTRGPSR